MQTMVAFLLLAVTFFSPQPDSSPALAGIAHVAFRVTDVQKSRDFYRTLGFEQSFEFNDPGKPPVSYIKINDHQFIELYGRGKESQPTDLLHLCYEAPSIESLCNEYVMRGLHPPAAAKPALATCFSPFTIRKDKLSSTLNIFPARFILRIAANISVIAASPFIY